VSVLGFGRPNVEKLAALNKIDLLVKATKYKKDPAVQEAARAALLEKMDTCIKTLQSKHLPHVYAAREALVIMGPPARDRLIFILGEGHVHRRQDVAYVLGEMRDPEAVPALSLAMHNPDDLLRKISVEALAKIGGPDAIEVIKAACTDHDPHVARTAGKALNNLKVPKP
jgi:HEAT repeat protein